MPGDTVIHKAIFVRPSDDLIISYAFQILKVHPTRFPTRASPSLISSYKEGFFHAGQDFTGKTRILNMIEFAFLRPMDISASELLYPDLQRHARSNLPRHALC